MKKAYIFLADGFEEIEAITPYDLLKRRGIDTKFVSVTSKREVKGSHDITVLADFLFNEVNFSYADALIIPGGMPGTKNLDAHKELCDLIKLKYQEGKIVSAICAGPMIFERIGILDGVKATIYPTFKDKITNYTQENVSVQGNIITANALGSAIEFSLMLVEKLVSKEESNSLREEIVF